MTNYRRYTVPQLRKESGKRGLPKYQRKGKRLNKGDLVAQLVKDDGRRSRPKPEAPRHWDWWEAVQGKIAERTHLRRDHLYAQAMHRVLNGFDKDGEAGLLLDAYRREAMRAVRDALPMGSPEWFFANDRYSEAVHFQKGCRI